MIATVLIATWPLVTSAQSADPSSQNALVDMLVWGADLGIDASAYPLPLRAEVEQYLRRSEAYRSKRPPPAKSNGELRMVYYAQIRYERRLVAVSDDPEAPELAVAYVDRLRPCYEWEGFHDCPEGEAVFAEEYQATHPSGPFREYLPLLAAHRWLCTAEAYGYEKRPEDAARSRRAYERVISTARRSKTLLIRTAAEGLMVRGSCFSPR